MRGICSSSSTRCIRYFSTSLSHVDPLTNRPCMVDITAKTASVRIAHAQAIVKLPSEAFNLICSSSSGKEKTVEIYSAKGPVFTTAIIAGVMGAKTTSTLLPFCHPLPLEHIDIKIAIDSERDKSLRIDCIVKTTHKTGVEMEAIVGATHASICIYDMLKAVSHNIVISEIKLMSKSGGKSDFTNTASSET